MTGYLVQKDTKQGSYPSSQELVENRLKKFLPLVVFLIAGSYYCILSAKTFTWIFASIDSGDWLACAKMWFVPQAFGSPLYITLARGIGQLPFDLPTAMTIGLSTIPATITIGLIYLIVKHLTSKELPAITSSAVLLGCAVFLSQATVVEEYSLAVMFLVGAFYCYTLNRKFLVALYLGLGTAVHIFIVPIAVLWFALNFKEWRVWAKTIPVYIASGILPYGLIAYLMTADTPRLLAGRLSLAGLNAYFGATEVIGSLNILLAPERIMTLVAFLLAGFGLAWFPIAMGIKKPRGMVVKMSLATAGFSIWYYATCRDPTTWVFLIWGTPFLAILAGIGLTKLHNYHIGIVLLGALALIMTNGFVLNADRLAEAKPLAVQAYNAVQSLPDGSVIIIERGGGRAFAAFYAYCEGKDTIPIVYVSTDGEITEEQLTHVEWIQKKFGLEGYNAQTLAQDALNKEIPVYIMIPLTDMWKPIFKFAETSKYEPCHRILSINTTAEVHLDEYIYKATGHIWDVSTWHHLLSHMD